MLEAPVIKTSTPKLPLLPFAFWFRAGAAGMKMIYASSIFHDVGFNTFIGFDAFCCRTMLVIDGPDIAPIGVSSNKEFRGWNL